MHIGRYEIRGLLGRGGMGAVYKALMPITGRIVALKVLKPSDMLEAIVGPDALTDMFAKEAITMARISHPNVASILDVDMGTPTVPPHFTMEYFCGNLGVLMGETYEVEKNSRRLGFTASLHIARAMLQGLDRLHFEGIVHRDIKPFNVMLAEDQDGPGRVKLIDFGLSKLRGETPAGHTGMVIGSPYYTAPEQEAAPETADARSDLYSVGVTLYRMLTGDLPSTPFDAALLAEMYPGFDSLWASFFTQALAADPTDRFPDATRMIRALDALESAWLAHKEAICLATDLLLDLDAPAAQPSPRQQPVKVSLKKAQALFDLDTLWRPNQSAPNDFQDLDNQTILNRTTGHIWEKHGTRYPLTWQHAHAHVRRLNHHQFAGHSNWRLPTIPELLTIFSPQTTPGERCLQPLFDPQKARLWSADTKAFTAAWYADAEMGFVWWQDLTCRFFVRAVCQ
ncbi:protein kinase [Pseudodesulfovibrio sp. JC047]|uniref:protein kinase domain-containing protein n=1 Tax=Pseudodesulfovibrio sp. JC047 TaxID=2683199 RepID=UPI0013D4FF32|nr:protein kinase [Pseudodesulfovibrio sp. JC047]NDV20265.1 protein kinase [Pseudodesulfovibrio sp. JC047]